MIPTWQGRVLSGGLLRLDRPADYARYVRSLRGEFVEVIVRKRKVQRSSQSNRHYWGVVVREIAQESGMTDQETHDALKYHLLRQPGDGPLVKVRSTTDLSVEEFSAYTEQCMSLGSEFYGIEWESR